MNLDRRYLPSADVEAKVLIDRWFLVDMWRNKAADESTCLRFFFQQMLSPSRPLLQALEFALSVPAPVGCRCKRIRIFPVLASRPPSKHGG